MKLLSSTVAVMLLLATAGCSTLPQRAASRSGEDAGIFDVTDYVGAAKNKESGGDEAAANPGQQTVSWEDNGKSIRELSPEDGPQRMQVPHAAQRKNGKIVATELAEPPPAE